MTAITGNTYAVREKLRALGGRWNAAAKCWMVPDDKAEQAQALVKPSRGQGRAPRTCATCGCRINFGIYCGKCEYR